MANTGAPLTGGELRKYMNGDSRSRVNIIREKIKDGTPFEMLDLNKTILDETKILKYKNTDIKLLFEKDNDEIVLIIEIHYGRSYWRNVDLFDIPLDSTGKNNSTFVKKV